jgi:2-keto-4-pentenoate hydratase/2-oxohepta-3-ene-1,7-dioic acid hydratase in catechol pathway
MKLATYRFNDKLCVGQWDETTRTVRSLSLDRSPVTDMVSLMADANLLPTCTLSDQALTLEQIKLLAPIPRPARNIFCVGKNYMNHAREFSRSGFDAGQSAPADAIPDCPIVFTKPPETVIAHGEPVWSAAEVTTSLDYEVELAVIIGQGGRGIRKSDAMRHVWGYTIINDVTARDWQRKHKQWFLGKSFDTFCPMGPIAVTADEVDAANLDVRCWVNGELRQNANTRDLIFDVPTIIETISAGITLYPGDIVATGTPEGVGIGFNPPKFLKSGDVMAMEITGLGRLENAVR